MPGVHRMFDLPLPMFRHVSPPDLYRHPDRDAQFYAGELDALIRTEGADTIAAFVAEPVMGTGGVLVPPSGYYQAIRKVLEEHDVLLVFDEVISGFGLGLAAGSAPSFLMFSPISSQSPRASRAATCRCPQL